MCDEENNEYKASTDTFYEYDANSRNWMTLQQFFQRYKHDFPLLCIVTEGDCGLTDYDDLCNGTVLRIHGYTSQRRVIAKKSELSYEGPTYYSIPIEENYKFCVVKSHKETREAQLLCDILAENNFPVHVQFPKGQVYFRLDSRDQPSAEVGTLILIDEYLENFLICNTIEEHTGKMLLGMHLIACTDSMNCTLVKGIRDKPHEEYVRHLNGLERLVALKGVEYKEGSGNSSATQFTETHTGSGNPIPKTDPPLYHIAHPPKRPFLKPPNIRPALPVPENSTDSISPTILKVDGKVDKQVNFTQMEKLQYKSQPNRYERLGDHISAQQYKKLGTSTRSGRTDQPCSREKIDIPQSPADTYSYIKDSDVFNSGRYEELTDEYVRIRKKERPQISDETYKDDQNNISKHRAVLETLTIKEVGVKLCRLGLKSYVKEFSKKSVDGACLVDYDRQILQDEFNLLGHEAIRLEKYIKSGHMPK